MVRRVAVVGPESVGKSTLVRRLATRLGVPWAPEVARGWLEARGGAYVEDDLRAIARGQRAAEAAAVARARPDGLVLLDTNLLVVRIWSEVVFGRVHPWITAHEDLDRYALHLVPAPDLPWTADPLRVNPDDRPALFTRYVDALVQARVPYAIVRGTGDARDEAARAALDPFR